MPDELTDFKLSKMRVGYKSDFLGREVRDHERIFICGGLFVQFYKDKHMFRYTYRDENKKQKQLSIGMFSLNGNGITSFTIEQAKAKYLADMAERRVNGRDPYKTREQKRIEREEETKRKALLFKLYWPTWVEKQNYGSEAHKKKVESSFNSLCASIADLPLVDITEDHIRTLLDGILEIAPKKVDTIHRLYLHLSNLFKTAKRQKLVTTNPMAEIYPEEYPAPKTGKYKHAKNLPELKQFLQVLPDIEAEPVTKVLLSIAPHLFMRASELRLMKYKDLDMENSIWYLHRSKRIGQSIFDKDIDTRPYDYCVPLSPQVKAAIESLYPLTGTKEYVFTGQDGKSPISDNTAGKALRNALKKKGLAELTTLYGFRYVARGMIPAILGIDKRIVEQQMSHDPSQNTGEGEVAHSSDKYGYDQYLYLPERRAMMDVWSDLLEGLVSDKFQILTPEQARQQVGKTQWQMFLEELHEKYKRLCGIYQQTAQ